MRCEQCGNDFPSFLYVGGKRFVLSSRRRCLECSPHKTMGSGDIVLRKRSSPSPDSRKCSACREDKPNNEFSPSRLVRGGLTALCKSCDANRKSDAKRALKRAAVQYKGGVCVECGYSGCDAALAFHHLDPLEKDFGIADLNGPCLSDAIRKELDKCVLLCVRCHLELHAGFRTLQLRSQ